MPRYLPSKHETQKIRWTPWGGRPIACCLSLYYLNDDSRVYVANGKEIVAWYIIWFTLERSVYFIFLCDRSVASLRHMCIVNLQLNRSLLYYDCWRQCDVHNWNFVMFDLFWGDLFFIEYNSNTLSFRTFNTLYETLKHWTRTLIGAYKTKCSDCSNSIAGRKFRERYKERLSRNNHNSVPRNHVNTVIINYLIFSCLIWYILKSMFLWLFVRVYAW